MNNCFFYDICMLQEKYLQLKGMKSSFLEKTGLLGEGNNPLLGDAITTSLSCCWGVLGDRREPINF